MTFAIAFVLFATFTAFSDAAACHEITDQTVCLNQDSCAWRDDPDNDLEETSCYCNSKKPLDVIFMMDASGSLTEPNFKLEQQFVIDMIQQGLAPDSNVHVAKFNESVVTVWEFTDDQSNNWEEATDAIATTAYYTGLTHMADALQYVQEVFNDEWDSNNDRLLVFLTDGEPKAQNDVDCDPTNNKKKNSDCDPTQLNTQDPCPEVEGTQDVVGEENIVVIGMSDEWTRESINCMVTPGYSHSPGANNADPDDSRIFNVTEFTEEDFDAVLGAISDILCPISMDLKLTEMSIESFSNGADTYHSRFVEFYNPGDALNFSLGVTNLKFEGFLDSFVFGPDSEQQCDVFVGEGQYVVIYDPNTADLPECLDCNCTLNDNTLQCDDAVYIPCDSDPSTSGCGACTWNDTMSNDEWYQKVIDRAGDEVLNHVIRDDADGWTDVRSGYTTELIVKTRDSTDPSNWEESCTDRGTPGADRVFPCSTTKAPTHDPTTYPTNYPTHHPTAIPTANPTARPTTPAPTDPGELSCGDHISGDYNGVSMEVEVRMPFQGDMTLDMSDSNFEVRRIKVVDSNDIVEICDSSICSLFDLDHGTDYFFTIEGAEGVAKGEFDIRIHCTSDAPTRSPTRSPSMEPTESPTAKPTADPTSAPTRGPTMKPTREPTAVPTADPTRGPTAKPTKTPSANPSSSPTMKPTGYPSPSPTESPSKKPTESPTAKPTTDPTADPTSDPTTDPTNDPTRDPTADPTVDPTRDPTAAPTAKPTVSPSTSPTTPTPTHPGELCCRSHSVGDYNGVSMEFEVRMHFQGDMTVDMSGSDFEVRRIEAVDLNGDIVGTCDSSICSLSDLDHGADYFFTIEGAEGVAKGTFDIRIECTSDAPTRSPSTEPTPSPTTKPTSNPSSSPTMKPTADPTSSPTMKPTGHPSPAPTTQPTVAPTTLEPTPFPISPPITPAPTKEPPKLNETACAPNGFLSPSGQVCCPMDQCSQCGGAGCSNNDINEGGTLNCCAEKIIWYQDLCDGTNFAPCVMYFDDPTCEEGFINGNNEVCCPEGICSQCGGAGCSNLEINPGGTADCCAGSIIESDIWCDEHAAPCILPSYRDQVSFPPFLWIAGVYTGIVRGEWTLWNYEIAGVVLVMSLSICVLCCALCSKQSVIRRKPKYVKVRLDSTTDDEAMDLM